MEKFLKKILEFVLVLLVISLIVDVLYSKMLQRVNYGPEIKWNGIVGVKVDADIVVLGNSRAWHMVSPIALDSLLKLNTYNLAVNASPINRQIAKFNLYRLRNNHPRLIVQNVDLFTMQYSPMKNGEHFFPYFWDLKFRSKMLNTESWTFAERILPLYRYAGYSPGTHNILFGGYKGFHPSEQKWDGTEYIRVDSVSFVMDERSERIFDNYLSNVAKDGVRVVLVYAPIYIGVTNKMTNLDEMYAFYKKYADKYDIPILDYNYMDICYDTTYFYNATHLNKRGAEIYSKALAEDIRNLGILQ